MTDKNLQPVRGTRDIVGLEAELFRSIEAQAWTLAKRYGYQEFRTPHFEMSSVFHRSLGETSDAVSKETYTFLDRGGESITLRPEGTAGIARAFVSNGLAQNLPVRAYYTGAMFRYERPQKGRYREFTQIGVETLGPDKPSTDVEVISLAYHFLNQLGLGQKFKLQLNSLGDSESRTHHRDKLVSYLTPFAKELSADSQVRLEKNPLRILDSKSEQDRKILQGAPALIDCWNSESLRFFNEVCELLTKLSIPFEHQAQLVRGFDYYTHTVFEFVTDQLGAQSAILSGGRYNGLIEVMGGGSVPGVGWGAGLDRLALLVQLHSVNQNLKPEESILVLNIDENSFTDALSLVDQLRLRQDLVVHFLSDGQIGKRLKKAEKLNAGTAIFVGGEEALQGKVAVKNLRTGTQTAMTVDQLFRR